MRRTSLTLLILVLPLAHVGDIGKAQAADSRATPELIVDVDVNDEVWLRAHKMTDADVKTLVAQLKQSGCQTLLVRCGCLGILPYRTDLSYPVGFDAEHARANPAPAIVRDMEAFIRQRTAWDKRYAEVIRDFNPPAVFIREGHQQGMRVIAWIDIFDDFFPAIARSFSMSTRTASGSARTARRISKGYWTIPGRRRARSG